MNQERTVVVSGFFLELPFSSNVCSRLRSVPSISICEPSASVAANSPNLKNASTRCHSVRDSHSLVCLFFQLSLVAKLSTVKFVLSS